MPTKSNNYGWLPDVPDHRDLIFRHNALIKLPPTVDLRSGMPPVYDQSQIGSCTANAIAAAFEYDLYKQGAQDFTPSRLFIYYNERVIEGTVSYDAGAMIRDGMKTIADQGVCHEDRWPYIISKFTVKPPIASYTAAQLNQALKYERVNPDMMLHCLAEGFPIVFGFTVYESFESDTVANTGIVPMPGPRESVLGGHAVLCLHEDTKIPLLNGAEKTIKEMANSKETEFWVYSYNNGKITAGKAHSVRKTGTNKPLIKITLDNGECLRCTPDHLIMKRDGSYCQAGKLQTGDSLMPLYRRISDENDRQPGYEMVLHPNTNSWQFTHRAVLDHLKLYRKVVHHADFNKRNNEPTNLMPLTWQEHNKLHNDHNTIVNKSPAGRARSSRTLKRMWKDPEFRKKMVIRNAENGKNSAAKMIAKGNFGWQLRTEKMKIASRRNGLNNIKIAQLPENQLKAQKKFKDNFENDASFREKIQKRAGNQWKSYGAKIKSGELKITEKQREARRKNLDIARQKMQENAKIRRQNTPTNHKIISIEPCLDGDVYDLTVENFHNFAISAGIFVHNCVGYNLRDKTFIVRNSWGPDWGMQGYFTMPMAYAKDPNLADDRWKLQLVEG